MAILAAIGFDDGVLSMGTASGNNNASVTATAALVRTGIGALKLTSSGISAVTDWTLNLPATLTTGWIYVAFQASTIPGTSQIIALLKDGATVHLDIRLRSDGRLEVTRNGTALTGGVGTEAFVADQYRQIAFKYTISNTVGVFQLRYDGSGTNDIDVTGADTQNGAAAQITNIILRSVAAASASSYFDDLIIQDGTGSSPENDWLGDIEAAYLWPTGTGDSSQWVVGGTSPAATDWESLDETTPDDATTTIDSNTVNDKTLMTYSDLVVTGGTIFAVCPTARAIKSSAGAREIQLLAKLSGTEAASSNVVLSTSWAWYQRVMHDDPAGSAWTGSNINNAQFGVKLAV